MEKFNIKVGKLSLESDDNVTGDTFISRPEKELGEKLGAIFGLVELSSLPESFLEDLVEILADLKTEYYLPPYDTEYGVEKRFEECLARANRRISKAINESIEKVDLRNINILIGLAYKNKIHLSQIGQVKALLYHEKKRHGLIIIDILAQAGEKKAKLDQEKMFSNLVSGEITIKDNIIICNDSVFEYVSQNDLGEIISENVSSSALTEISNALKETSGGGNTNFYCLLLEPDYQGEEIIAPEEDGGRQQSVEPRRYASGHPQGSIEQLLTTQNRTEKYLAPSLMPNWQKILMIIGSGLLFIIKKAGYYLLKLLRLLYKYLRIGLIRLQRSIAAKTRARRGLAAIDIAEAGQKTDIAIHIDKAEEEKIEPETFTDEPMTPEPAVSALATDTISGKINWQLNRLAAWAFGLRLWQKSILIVVFILIFLFSQSVVLFGRSEENVVQESGLETLTKRIEDKLNNAEAQNIFNDENGAKQSLAEARDLIAQIPDKNKYDSERERLQARIDGLIQALQKITYLDNPKVIADLTKLNGNAQSAGLARVGNTLLSFDNNNQNLYLIDEASGQATSTVLRELSQVRKITTLNGQAALILNGEKEVFIFDLAKKTLTKAYASDVKINDLEVYEGKVYLLKAEKTQIYRHTITDNKLGSGSAWITEGDANKGTAIALDGGLYLGREGGELKHFNRGKLEDKNWSAIEPPLSSISQLATTPQSNYVFVLDGENKRVVAFDNNGTLRKQYTSKNFSSVSSLALLEKEKKIYLLSDNKVYLIEIDF